MKLSQNEENKQTGRLGTFLCQGVMPQVRDAVVDDFIASALWCLCIHVFSSSWHNII